MWDITKIVSAEDLVTYSDIVYGPTNEVIEYLAPIISLYFAAINEDQSRTITQVYNNDTKFTVLNYFAEYHPMTKMPTVMTMKIGGIEHYFCQNESQLVEPNGLNVAM